MGRPSKSKKTNKKSSKKPQNEIDSQATKVKSKQKLPVVPPEPIQTTEEPKPSSSSRRRARRSKNKKKLSIKDMENLTTLPENSLQDELEELAKIFTSAIGESDTFTGLSKEILETLLINTKTIQDKVKALLHKGGNHMIKTKNLYAKKYLSIKGVEYAERCRQKGIVIYHFTQSLKFTMLKMMAETEILLELSKNKIGFSDTEDDSDSSEILVVERNVFNRILDTIEVAEVMQLSTCDHLEKLELFLDEVRIMLQMCEKNKMKKHFLTEDEFGNITFINDSIKLVLNPKDDFEVYRKSSQKNKSANNENSGKTSKNKKNASKASKPKVDEIAEQLKTDLNLSNDTETKKEANPVQNELSNMETKKKTKPAQNTPIYELSDTKTTKPNKKLKTEHVPAPKKVPKSKKIKTDTKLTTKYDLKSVANICPEFDLILNFDKKYIFGANSFADLTDVSYPKLLDEYVSLNYDYDYNVPNVLYSPMYAGYNYSYYNALTISHQDFPNYFSVLNHCLCTFDVPGHKNMWNFTDAIGFLYPSILDRCYCPKIAFCPCNIPVDKQNYFNKETVVVKIDDEDESTQGNKVRYKIFRKKKNENKKDNTDGKK